MLEISQLIEKLEKKGVVFEKCSKKQAAAFMREHSYYLKVAAYRKNFEKKDGTYDNLDFKALMELSKIDMKLREIVLKVSLETEKAVKVDLLSDIQRKNLNDFKIVEEYANKNPRAFKNVERKKDAVYVRNLCRKFDKILPVRAFTEISSFSDLLGFLEYYEDRYGYKKTPLTILHAVKNIRNAAAHNNCIIHDLKDDSCEVEKDLLHAVCAAFYGEKSAYEVNEMIKNFAVHDFSALITAFFEEVKSESIKKDNIDALNRLFFDFMKKSGELFEKAPVIINSYEFVKDLFLKKSKDGRKVF